MRIHFIAIGGAAMHSLALALQKNGHDVSGSDDQIFEPSRGRLADAGLLPKVEGWNPEQITQSLDVIILGMHAKVDNPELLKAQELGLKVYSYPEFLYRHSINKKRVVIAGSHGKTTITSMVLHALKKNKVAADYMVGAQLDGYDNPVHLTDENEIIILEGDEYLSSPVDRRPKFIHYKPQITCISGIAWDHINVFPTEEIYDQQFADLATSMPMEATLIYNAADSKIAETVVNLSEHLNVKTHHTPKFRVEEEQVIVDIDNHKHPLNIIGEHNVENLATAQSICEELGVSANDFWKSVQDFSGASKRLQKIAEKGNTVVFKDFAHAPSKLKATVNAAKTTYPSRKIIACVELHTFSSLTKAFLPHYKGTLDEADQSLVYYNHEVVKRKKLEQIHPKEMFEAFENNSVRVSVDSVEVMNELKSLDLSNSCVLIMTSGNFDGVDIDGLGQELV